MKNYIKKQVQPMMPYEYGMNMDGVSISEVDKSHGSPQDSDMIAVSPSNSKDRWLVAEQFFIDNYTETD